MKSASLLHLCLAVCALAVAASNTAVEELLQSKAAFLDVESERIVECGDQGARVPCGIRRDACTIPRVDGRTLTLEQFETHFRDPGVPVIVENGLPEDWPATRWTFRSVLDDYGKLKVRVAGEEDEELEEIEVRALVYEIADVHEDGEPLERAVVGCIDHDAVRFMEEDYGRHPVLGHGDVFQDIFEWLEHVGFNESADSFTPRYFIAGPLGAGAAFHRDYWGTSFWNALIRGRKHWVLYPPSLMKEIGVERVREWAEMPAFESFAANETYMEPSVELYECTQKPGDVVWAPSGWYHVTYNLAPSLGLSQNTILPSDFRQIFDIICYPTLRQEEKEAGMSYVLEQGTNVVNAIYMCAGLFKVNPYMFDHSCCATRRFRRFLDRSFTPVIGFTVLDQVENSVYYEQLLTKLGWDGDQAREVGMQEREETRKRRERDHNRKEEL